MATYDKSQQVGYDEQDRRVTEALEELAIKNPKLMQRLQHRIHDGILTRLKEEGTQKCHTLVAELEKCVNTNLGTETRCFPQRDVVNECYRSVNTEENYQRLRLQYMTGELKHIHDAKMAVKIESFKAQVPDALPNWKVDYGDRYYDAMKNIEQEPLNPAEVRMRDPVKSGRPEPDQPWQAARGFF